MWAEAQAPASIGREANISFFSGYLLKQQNMNSNARYIGVYADFPLLKTQKFNLGIYGVYDASSFQDNMVRYKSSTSEMAGGLNTGLYFEARSIYSFYSGLAVGYKNSQEKGIVNKKNYYSEGKQSDNMIVANLNFNLFRDARWFPRTQLIGNWQMTLDSTHTISENGQASYAINSWDKGFQEITLKQSLVGIPLNLGGDRLLEPKLGIAYHHYNEGYPEAYSLIAEIAFKKLFADDFLTFTFQYKDYPGKKTDYFCYGITVNILRLIEKRR